MDIKTNTTVAEIVASNFNTSKVFYKFNVDFCCGGDRALVDCVEENELKQIIEELEQVESGEKAKDYQNWNLDFLIDYIEQVHHSYVRENSNLLLSLSHKVASVHGEEHPELYKICDIIKAEIPELEAHLKREELILFPYVKQLVKAKQLGVLPREPHFGTVKNPIQVMEDNHEDVGNVFKELRLLTQNYAIPNDACDSYKLLYKTMSEFEKDLHVHIHLENNIVHKKALALELETRS